MVPGWAGALGLGEITLSSRLNQPLQAEIPLYAVRPNDVGGMKIALASAAQFRRAGVERPFYLTRINFAAEDNGDGSGRIRVSTNRPVNEPFLNFLVEVDWQTGRLVREFTLLLDPPVYGAAMRSKIARVAPTVAPNQPRQVATASTVHTASVAQSSGPFANRNAGLQASTGASAQSAPAQTLGAAPKSSGTYGPVKRNDTLWALATRLRPDRSVSVHRMMLSILNANPQAFINGNVNALRAGSILNVPSLEAISSVKQGAALAEIRSQNAVWKGLRRQAAATAAERPVTAPVAVPAPAPAAAAESDSGASEQVPAPVANADVSAAKLDVTPAIAPATATSNDGTLKIVGAGGDDAAGAGTDADVVRLGEQVDLVREELAQSRNETDDLKAKLDQAESIIADMERLTQIRDDQLAQLQQQLAQTQSALEQAAAQMVAASEPTEIAPALATTGQSDTSPSDTSTRATNTPTADSQPTQSPPSTGAEAGETAPVAATTAQTDTAKAQAAPVKERSVVKPPAVAPALPAVSPSPPPKSIVEQAMAMAIMLDPSILLGFGGAILAVLGLGWYRVRSKKQRAAAVSETLEEVMLDNAAAVSEATQVSDRSPGPAADHGVSDSATTAALFDKADTHTVAVLDDDDNASEVAGTMRADQSGDDDPLQEANVYLAYERFDQAEEVVKGAIETYPDRSQYRLKLLEIYHGMGNRAAFDGALIALQGVVAQDSELLARANELGQTFAQTAAVETGVDFDLGTGTSTSDTLDGGVDFDLGFSVGEVAPASANIDNIPALGSDSSIDTAHDEDGVGTTVDFVLDSFDGGPQLPTSQALGESTDVDSDLNDAHAESPASYLVEGARETQLLDFDVAFGDTNADGITLEDESETTGSVDFDLNMFADAETLASVSGDAGVAAPDAASKSLTDVAELDFELDFGDDLTEAPSQPAGATDTATMQNLVPEAFETVQLNLKTVEGTSASIGADDFADVSDVTDIEALGLDFSLDDEDDKRSALVSSEIDQDLIETVSVSREDAGIDDSDLGSPIDLSGQTGVDASELPSVANEETAAPKFDFDLDLDDDMVGTLTDTASELSAGANEDDEAELTLGEDLHSADPMPERDVDDLMEGLDAALAADSEIAPAGDFEQAAADLAESLSEFDASVLDDDPAPGDWQSDDSGLELPEDLLAATEIIPVQMPDELTTEISATVAERESQPLASEGQDGASVVLDLVLVDETTDPLADVILQEETVDISGLDIQADFVPNELTVSEFSDLSSGDVFDTRSSDSEDSISLDLAVDDNEALGFGLEGAADDEQTVDVDGSDVDSSTDSGLTDVGLDLDLDLDFDPADVPLEVLETHTHLAAEQSDDEKTHQNLDTVILDASSDGAGGDTTSLGPLEALVDDGEELDFDLSDFDPLAASEAASDDAPSVGSDERAIDFPLDESDDTASSSVVATGSQMPTPGLGTIDDEDEDETLVLGNALSREVDAMQTKLDLAQEFAELGDSEAARDALREVIAEGDIAQQQAARALLDSLPT
jgi:pilus assembly protein FimV